MEQTLPWTLMTADQEQERFLNWSNYLEAWKVYDRFIQENFAEAVTTHREANSEKYVPVNQIHVAPENLTKPKPDHFALFSDILGFSVEVSKGTDSLPDFYGAAFYFAHEEQHVKVYVLSDSCLAFCATSNREAFLRFASQFTDNRQSDGILHQSFIGYGSFVDRSPNFGGVPNNFFGRQVVGTALVDVARIRKIRPFGARILMSPCALDHWPDSERERTICFPNGEIEYLPERPKQFDLFDCIYYFLCLRDHAKGTRSFQHYVWSIASRFARLGSDLGVVAAREAAPAFKQAEFEMIITEVNRVLSSYIKAKQEKAQQQDATDG